MPRRLMIYSFLILCGGALAQSRRLSSPLPDQFVLARHTFFDFGPPTDYYELYLVEPSASGTSIERITLTPAVDVCNQPATIETASSTLSESVASLLGTTNPCAIPEKELRRERKRCKKCLTFSGANVAMQVQCGGQTRIIRSDILDRDMFDPASNTPKNTSWTMNLLTRLDHTLGPGVMDKQAFPAGDDSPSGTVSAPQAVRDIGSGKYDVLFVGAPDKPSDLFHAAQVHPVVPSVRLLNSSPFQPLESPLPKYPALARVAHVQGQVSFNVAIDANGSPANFTLVNGHPLLVASVQNAVSNWKFPKELAGQQTEATIEFATNCPAKSK